jgi:hypothetical protein
VVNCWTHEYSLNLLEPCVGAADRGPNLEFRVDYRLPVSYHLCTTQHAYGAEAVMGAATVLVAAIHTTGRQSSLQAASRSQYMK